jgi:hypothetical protein
MNWQVTYRSRDGKQVVDEFEAESREALFAALKTKGVNAIKVVECKAGKRPQRTAALPHGATSARSHTRPVRRAIVWAIIGVAVAIAAWFIAMRGDQPTENLGEDTRRPTKLALPEQNLPSKTSSGVASSTSAPATNAPLSRRERELKEIREKFGDNIPENLKATVYFLEHPPQKTFKVKSNEDYLRHPSERQIAGVALMEPGTYFVTKPEFGESFDRDFLDAMIDKIEIYDDDSDDVKSGKQSVTELKKEIADICKKEGKTPSEVMNELAATMYELGKYQRDIEEELDKIHEDAAYSDEEFEDFCEAANRMLEAKGLPPLSFPDIARRSFRIRAAQRMAERKAARDAAKETK